MTKNKKLLYGILVAVLVLVAVGVVLFLEQKQQRFKDVSLLEIEQVKEQYAAELMAIDGVVGVAIGKCWYKLCIKVFLENDSSELKKQIPKQLDKFKVDTEVTGTIREF